MWLGEAHWTWMMQHCGHWHGLIDTPVTELGNCQESSRLVGIYIYIYIHFFSVIYIELCRSTGNALWLATLPLTNFEVMAWSPGRQLSSRRRGFHFHVSWRVPSLCNIKGWNDFWKTIWIETSRKYMPKNTNPYVPLCHQRGHQRHRHVTGTSSFSTYLTPNEGSISSGDQRSTKNPCKWREYGWSANN